MKNITYICNLCAEKKQEATSVTGLQRSSRGINEPFYLQIVMAHTADIHICKACYEMLNDLFVRENTPSLKHQ